MELFQLNISVGDREIECTVKKGVLATIETGLHEDKVETPENRVLVMVGDGRNEASAWIQVSNYDGEQFTVAAEGWVDESGDNRTGPSNIGKVAARMKSISENDVASLKTHEDAVFARSRCCTSYGRGCYVKCCGGCCSDPTKCPGASCCP